MSAVWIVWTQIHQTFKINFHLPLGHIEQQQTLFPAGILAFATGQIRVREFGFNNTCGYWLFPRGTRSKFEVNISLKSTGTRTHNYSQSLNVSNSHKHRPELATFRCPYSTLYSLREPKIQNPDVQIKSAWQSHGLWWRSILPNINKVQYWVLWRERIRTDPV